jgi:hypothetical protein
VRRKPTSWVQIMIEVFKVLKLQWLDSIKLVMVPILRQKRRWTSSEIPWFRFIRSRNHSIRYGYTQIINNSVPIEQPLMHITSQLCFYCKDDTTTPTMSSAQASVERNVGDSSRDGWIQRTKQRIDSGDCREHGNSYEVYNWSCKQYRISNNSGNWIWTGN